MPPHRITTWGFVEFEVMVEIRRTSAASKSFLEFIIKDELRVRVRPGVKARLYLIL
jgi:hypothetical protein